MTGEESLDSGVRQKIGAFWISRARAELDAGAHFEVMTRRLAARGAPAEIVLLAERAAKDEERHSALCLEVAAAYLGEAPPALPAPSPDPPSFGVAGEELTTTLHVVLSSCISEGIATSFLLACLEQAQNDRVRSALRVMVEDEVSHARVGWAYLATIGPDERREVGRALPALLRVARETWLGTNTTLPVGHGSLSSADLVRVVDDAIASLILPGFRQLGVAV